MIYEVSNWRRFQHYKDRNPPWIKLHYELLASRDWVMLDDSARVLAIACMLIASRNDGKIDGSPAGLDFIRRVAYLNTEPDLTPLIDIGFLGSACNTLPNRPQRQRQRQRQSKKGNAKKPPDFGSVENLDPQAWAAWMVYRKAEQFPKYKSTQVATKLAKYPAEVQRIAVETAITAGWRGFFPQKVIHEKSGQRGASRSFEESTKRLGDWYLEQTGNVLPIDH